MVSTDSSCGDAPRKRDSRLNVDQELAQLKRMTVDELRTKYVEVFGESTNGRNKDWLVKRIIWRMQANAAGDLSERARRRAAELADDAYLRMTPPRESKQPSPNAVTKRATRSSAHHAPLPGTTLVRQYKGRTIEVHVTADGFVFEGERYKSLSAVAKAVTGSHWSGHRFFGLQKGGAK